ncbi:NAD-dependent epimerase/dehydratase family protein [Siphonobacter sp.]|uniref:NAD-dependent epimerase/dehydratase family protein n=1 Tax=Siphonobacter sp. TaxID=1869184 RepID=UPI003B3B724B
MQTILGSGGAVSVPLAQHLRTYTDDIRLVSRTPQRVNPTDTLFPANLLDAAQVDAAVAGSSIVYLTAGLPYRTKLWQQQWPIVIQNVLQACRNHQARLVFLDNIYALGYVHGPMTEETPLNPVSKKGEVRAKIARQLQEENQAGNVEIMIARAPDFYGPNVKTSVVDITVIQNLKKGKKAQWLINSEVKHSFIFTPDAGHAVALLGNTPEAFGQIWHLPTAAPALTGAEFIAACAQELGVSSKFTTLPKWMVQLGGLFVPDLKESVEMLYQYEHEYLFDSSKFEKHFALQPTSYQEGIRISTRA